MTYYIEEVSDTERERWREGKGDAGTDDAQAVQGVDNCVTKKNKTLNFRDSFPNCETSV